MPKANERSLNGAPEPIDQKQDDPEYRESYALGLLQSGAIRVGETKISDLRLLFKDYHNDFVVFGDDSTAKLATFYFVGLKASAVAPGETPKSISRCGRYMNFRFNGFGILLSSNISNVHKGFLK